MIIKSLTIKGFKSFEDEHYFIFNDNSTIIEGENFQGKTSVGEAICWCLLGCNLFGNDKTSSLINNNSKSIFGKLVFEDNEGIEHTLIRSKGKENIVILDGQKADSDVLSKYYGEKKMFLSIYNPYYFSSLEPKDQRELLRSVLPTINYREAFNLLSQSEREILVEPRIDLNGFIKNAREELKELEKERSNYEGKIQYANSIVVSHVGEEKIFEQEETLKSLEIEYERVLKSVSGDTKKEMKLRMDELNHRIGSHNKLIEKLRVDYKNTQKIIEDIKHDNSVCPICNSKIIDEEKAKELIKLQKDNLEEIKQKRKRNRSRTEEFKVSACNT